MTSFGCIKFVLLFSVTCYVISSASAQQFDTTTDPARCCKRLANTTHSDATCKSTKLTATQFQQSIATPNYPKAFEADSFCTWDIYAMPGRRILLNFRDMHLAPKNDAKCYSQKLFIKSPLTGMSMGPFCAHDGLPNIVTTGNHVTVELQSPNPTNGRDYKGFKMVYTETVQATSIELRPPDWSDGMYLEYQTPRTPMKPSRYKPPRRTNSVPTTTAENQNSNKPKEPVKKKPPKERDRFNSNFNNRNIVPLRPYIPVRRIPTRIREKDDQESMGTEVIVGIIVGGIVIIAFISIVVAKLSHHRSTRRRKREEQEEESRQQQQQRMRPVQKTTQLPSARKAEVKKGTRPKHTNSQTRVSHVNEYMTHPSAKYRSDSRRKKTSSKKPNKTPDSRERSRRSKENKPDRGNRPSDRKRLSQKSDVRKSDERDRNSNHPKRRNPYEKTTKRRSDR